MPYCPSCGAPYHEGEYFCPSCGAPLPNGTESSSPFDEGTNRSYQPPVEPGYNGVGYNEPSQRGGAHYAGSSSEPTNAPVPASQAQSGWDERSETMPATYDGRANESAFKQAWHDFKESPGKVGIIVKLSLVCLIPVVGPIMAFGYIYTWAADRAYGNRVPLPASVMNGLYLLNGWRALLVSFVWALALFLVDVLLDLLLYALLNPFGVPAIALTIVVVVVDVAVDVFFAPLVNILGLSSIVWRGMGEGFNIARAWRMYFQSNKFKEFLVAYLVPELIYGLISVAVAAATAGISALAETAVNAALILCLLVEILLSLLTIPISLIGSMIMGRSTAAVMSDLLAGNRR